MRIAHIYAANAKKNSGDFLIGVATKAYITAGLLIPLPQQPQQPPPQFTDLDCRIAANFTDVDKLNTFDAIVVGGGGLLLPDSEPNLISCWQWLISQDTLEKITVPIYVCSIGYNLFPGQTMEMPDRGSNRCDPRRLPILIPHLQTLLRKAVHFSMRHRRDIEQTLALVGEEFRGKIAYEPCPTIWYSRTRSLVARSPPLQRYIGIEIKDDRDWRRYYKCGKGNFYAGLLRIVRDLQAAGKQVAIVSHDGSRSFHDTCVAAGIRIPLLDNSSASEERIYGNYATLSMLLCTAGHSQMIAYGLGIPTISIITHPKLRNFCDDMAVDDGVVLPSIDINEDAAGNRSWEQQLRALLPL